VHQPFAGRGDGIERPVPQQLVPPRQHDVTAQLAHYSRPAEDFRDRSGSIGFAAVELAKVDMPAAQMNQTAGRDYFDPDPRVAAHYSLAAEKLRQARFVLHPLCRVGITPPSARHPRIAGCSLVGVVGLHAKQGQIAGRESHADPHSHSPRLTGPPNTRYRKPMLAHRAKVIATPHKVTASPAAPSRAPK
jgi:hypothetical protein